VSGSRCVCGWERPVLALTTPTGALPRDEIVVVIFCPRCQEAHICGKEHQSVGEGKGTLLEVARKIKAEAPPPPPTGKAN
jgi:hypothetical protein